MWNSSKPFPLEKMLRNIAINFFVVGIYDCCREKVATLPSRGSGGDDDPDGIFILPTGYIDKFNYMAIFGCAPSYTVV